MTRKRRNSKTVVWFVTPLSIFAALGWFVYLRLQTERLRPVLFSAIAGKDPEAVRSVLAQGADPNARDTPEVPGGLLATVLAMFRRTPRAHDSAFKSALMAACGLGRVGAADILIKNGAHVNARMDDGSTPLWFAAECGSSDIVRMLLNHGAKVNSRNSNGSTALMSAARQGDITSVDLLIKRGADGKIRDNGGRQAIYYAAISGRIDIYEPLLNIGADVNTEFESTEDYQSVVETLLVRAVSTHDLSTVNLLLTRDADTEHMLPDGKTALTVAFENTIESQETTGDSGDVAKARRANRERVDLEILEALLDHGANPNVRIHEGKPLIIQAIDVNRPDLVELLIRFHADLNCRYEDHTPLLEAVVQRNTEIVRLLLRHSLDPNARDSTGASPLLIASYNGDEDIVDLLRFHGADVNVRDLEGHSVAHYSLGRLADRDSGH